VASVEAEEETIPDVRVVGIGPAGPGLEEAPYLPARGVPREERERWRCRGVRRRLLGLCRGGGSGRYRTREDGGVNKTGMIPSSLG
jgi:hypothetical protein